MNKRLLKRHKRQVSRAKAQAKPSEPDMRTREQIKAAREASRPASGRRNGAQLHYSASPSRNHASPTARAAAKVDD